MKKFCVALAMLALTVIFLFPLLFTFYYALLPLEDFGTLAPVTRFTLKNFIDLATKYSVAKWTLNTFIITACTLTGSLAVNISAGYALGAMRFPGRQIFFYIILGSMMVPFHCVLTPVYLQIAALGWADKLISCIVPFLMNCLYVFIARQYFCTFPRVLSEAALIDGLGEFGVFFRVVLPNSVPIIVTLIILCFTGSWNNYLVPATFLTSLDKFPLSVGIKTVKDYMFQQRNMTLAGVVILSMPILVCFFVLQKYFVKGVITSGIK